MPVVVEGLDELVRAAGRIDKGMSRELRKELRVSVGGSFARDAKEKVPVLTGRAKRGIRPSVRGTTVYIKNTATNRGFNYPAVLEFANGGANASLGPTADEWNSSGKLVESMEGFMDWIDTEWQR